ncbi:protein-disulfide reductase DsbD [Paenochrobactrum sp. BZR 588]|uniref:protein-disulfide reductase DsbD n=1 Tax=unclassified Paenochrobactrum TaxID=2639760 RepID=UPI0038536B83
MRLLTVILMMLISSVINATASPLPVDEAFRLQILSADDHKLVVSWNIHDGYYLYKDHIEATDIQGNKLVIDAPEGIMKDDPTFGAMQVYFNRTTVSFDLKNDQPVTLTYQGCQNDGICYRPETRTIDPLTLAASNPFGGGVAQSSSSAAVQWKMEAPVNNAPVATSSTAPASASTDTFQITQDKGMIQSLLERGGTGFLLLSFLAFGILLAFTPCVFPMYPIVAGTLAREGDKLTPMRGFLLTSTYVVALALGFALIGAVAGWSGQNLQMALQSPWLALAVAIVFVVLALSMFGLYELQLPSSWMSAVSRRTGSGKGSLGSAAVLGFSSVLIVGPCVTAPLAGALLYIAQTANVSLGAAALFALGLGKGIPLIILATFGSSVLPRAGGWMENVKTLFGFGFLATSIWMAAPLLPLGADLFLWAILLFAFSAYLFAKEWHRIGFRVIARTAATTAVVYGAILMLGASLGGVDPLKPLAPLVASGGQSGASVPALHFANVGSSQQLQTNLQQAKQERPTLVYFTADWCVACHTIERSVLTDMAVRRGLTDFDLVKVDLSDVTPENDKLMRQLRVAGPPTMIFFNEQSKEVADTRLVGNVTTSTLTSSAAKAGGA